MKLRLFIAFPLKAEVVRHLGELIEHFRPMTNAVRWVKPSNIHLTARFLGDTDEKLVPELTDLLDKVGADHSATSFLANRVGGFPNLRRPSVIWVGPSEPTDSAANIARTVELQVRRLRFESEKRGFKPHLTLGRVRRGQQIGDLARELENYEQEPVRVDLDRLVLFKSTLTPEGPIYERLHESTLKSGG